MDILSSHIIRRILSERGFSPKKRLGQNFLTSASVRDAVVEAGAVSATDTVLEIGPGLGALTRALIRKAGRVVAVEKDKDLFSILQETFGHVPHLTILNRDILSVSPEEIVQPPYKVVANLPYSITSPVIRMFLETAFRPSCMALMVQKEVAKRICAPPPSMTLLAASVQYYASPRIARTVKKTSFWPVPAVDSAILVITPFPNAPNKTEAEMFFSIVHAGFLHPRKQIQNNISEGLGLSKTETARLLSDARIDPMRRAETCTVQEWKCMAKIFPMRYHRGSEA